MLLLTGWWAFAFSLTSVAATVELTQDHARFVFDDRHFQYADGLPEISPGTSHVLVTHSDGAPLFHYERDSLIVDPAPLPWLLSEFHVRAEPGFYLTGVQIWQQGTFVKPGGFLGVGQALDVAPGSLLGDLHTDALFDGVTGTWQSSARIDVVPTSQEIMAQWSSIPMGTSFRPGSPVVLELMEIRFSALTLPMPQITEVPLPGGFLLLLSGLLVLRGRGGQS